MESKCYKRNERNEEDSRLSVSALFFDFFTKNVAMPSELGELVAYVVLLVISWYALIFAVRFMLSLVKPVLVILAALLLFRFLRTFESTDVKDVFIEFSSPVIICVFRRIELIMRLLD